ncbi:transglycosylase domain-containing protein [Granulicella arctica]|uniref:peptidoglycan glycosyltransferase n=1 Tax=Granulicella arctica TaxID=940613 RepID=A0A7Y9PHX7_9BACT|nr:transglycosylase domain-containing protein [Granulicella arctica]NYF79476.1 penicillin-binding protein 1B [Granulicella arctica]
MAVKLKLANTPRSPQSISLGWRIARVLLVMVLAVLLVGACIFGYFYHHYENVVDDRLAAGPLFASVAQIYAAPREVRTGQKMTVEQIAQDLRRAGYNGNTQLGSYQVNGDNILIKPGPQSYHSPDGATINAADGVVQSITAENGVALRAYELEPQLITALSEDKNRTKRRLVTYKDIPPQLVQAVTSIEDRSFFEHGGIDYLRIAKCAVQDVIAHRLNCGGSTLTQQLARGFFLSPDKKFVRKFREILITFQLEARFSKQQIFEMYANEINLGQRGSFAINGFGEASQAFFGKDMRQLDLAECALLAGTIQSPNRLNPYRHAERAMERRNLVLDAMVKTNSITEAQAEHAKAEPLGLAPPNVDGSEAPYFVDLVHEQLVQRIGDQAMGHDSLRIYTSLDPELQRAASDAVDAGMKSVDELIRKLHRTPKGGSPGPITYPQVSLVAINPHTGQILALVGGRNYGTSQLNHAVAERPTGSIFKPFVYATAYNTALNGTNIDGNGVFTALTKLNDDPTNFAFGGKDYTPGNFEKGEYPGMVTAVQAIVHSLNIATINLARLVGYDNVASLARSSGIVNARGTPSVAIGTYNATPIDMAGAYTVFANNGVHLKPWMLASVRNTNGDIVADFSPEAKQVLDPRTAFLTQSLLENVMSFGTGSAVRKYGFFAPAAGKTGTSHDVWFAGYTSNLLCIIWVGNDDYTDISTGLSRRVQGADTAAPIWAEFMNRAIKLPQYSDMTSFTAPSGVSVVRLDRATNLPADATCPTDYNVAFLDGTAPQGTCSHMGDSSPSFLQRIFGSHSSEEPAPAAPVNRATPSTSPNPSTAQKPTQPATSLNPNPTVAEPPKKKGFFHRLFGGGGDKQTQTPPPDQQPQ